jgi:small-conductance mechanosensitive channel
VLPPEINILGRTFDDSVYIPVGSLVFMFVWMMLGLSLRTILVSRLKHLAKKTDTHLDDLLIDALNLPVAMLVFASGLLVLVRLGVSTDYVSHQQLYNLLLVVAILSIVLFADRVLRSAIRVYSEKVELFRVAGGLVQSCVRGVVLIVGIMVLLGTLGINITPLIASLGVGSLAVALALQPTMENFFAGLQVISDRQIMEGHFIRLESGEEGFVHKINMRSTWLRTPQGNMIVFPNKLLVTTRIMNYNYPEQDTVVSVALNVHCESDMDKVERVVLDIAKQVQQEAENAIRDHEPAFRIVLLADSSITISVALKVDDVNNGGTLRHEFLKRILKRFKEEKIVIPYPVRALNLSQEKSELPRVA